MLERVTADEVIRRATSGRTGPVVMVCNADTDNPVELFCKLSSGCDEGLVSLSREVVASCLAVDLGLPVPVPYIVDIPSELAACVTDASIAHSLTASFPVAFGSRKVKNQFGTWTTGTRITETMLPTALSGFVFDMVLDNADRRRTNPNCLVSGDRFRLIDHELAFPSTTLLFGYKPPWAIGGMDWTLQDGAHIFYPGLKGRSLDFSPVKAVWSAVTEARLMEYRAAIPQEWSSTLPAVDNALARIAAGRDNIDGVVAEAIRILR